MSNSCQTIIDHPSSQKPRSVFKSAFYLKACDPDTASSSNVSSLNIFSSGFDLPRHGDRMSYRFCEINNQNADLIFQKCDAEEGR